MSLEPKLPSPPAVTQASFGNIDVGTAMIIFMVCAGLFQAKSIILALFSIAILCAIALTRLPISGPRLRLPTVFLCFYLIYVIANLAIHNSITDLISPSFLRYDGKLLATLMIFLAAIFVFDAAPEINTFWSVTVGVVLCSAVFFPVTLLFGDKKSGLLIGFFTSHNALAGASGSVVLLIACTQAHFRRTEPLFWGASIITGCLGFYIFLLAGSRAFMLGLAGATAYLVLTSRLSYAKKLCSAAIVMSLLVTTILASPAADRMSYDYVSSDNNLLTRISYWQRAISFISDSPLIGMGIGSFNDSSLQTEQLAPGVKTRSTSTKFFGENHAHNIVLHILSEQGVIGLTLLTSFWWAIISRHPRNIDRVYTGALESFDRMSRTVRSMFIYLLAASMLGNNLLTMSTAFIFYLVAASFVSSTVRNNRLSKMPLQATRRRISSVY